MKNSQRGTPPPPAAPPPARPAEGALWRHPPTWNTHTVPVATITCSQSQVNGCKSWAVVTRRQNLLLCSTSRGADGRWVMWTYHMQTLSVIEWQRHNSECHWEMLLALCLNDAMQCPPVVNPWHFCVTKYYSVSLSINIT